MFQGTCRFYTWLFRIAKNLAFSHLRRAGKVKYVSMTAPADEDPDGKEALTAPLAAQREGEPAERAMAAETLQRIEQALAELDEEDRLTVLLRDVEDLRYEEIAEILELPLGTVKSRLHRARCALREKLADLVN